MLRAMVVDAAASMPSSCWGTYRRVAVVLVPLGLPAWWRPKQISERAVGVLQVRRSWERLNVGSSARCAFERALAEAQEVADEYNLLNPVPEAPVTPDWYENQGEGRYADQLRRALAQIAQEEAAREAAKAARERVVADRESVARVVARAPEALVSMARPSGARAARAVLADWAIEHGEAGAASLLRGGRF